MKLIDVILRFSRVAIIGFLFVLIISLTASERKALSAVEGSAESHFKLLDGYSLIPGSAVLVEGGYIVALFQNAEAGLYALVTFAAACDSQRCTIEDLVAYTLFSETQTAIRLAQA
ncbi:MAG: hypothetical protein HY695_25755 [Deltaproteobacteria bacterium]|nr:hypothetical protein [Deltaproteobacteria bacterium]